MMDVEKQLRGSAANCDTEGRELLGNLLRNAADGIKALRDAHERLREALAEIEKLPGNTYCGDIARRALGGNEND